MRLIPGAGNQREVTIQSENGTRTYKREKGAFHVDNPADARTLRKELECFTPYTQMRSGRPGWICSCGWKAAINHCPKCDRSDLTRERA